MNETVALLAYTVAAGTGGAAVLRRAAWPVRAPRLGVAAWQILSGSVLLALLLAGLTVTVPSMIVSTNLADLLHACVMALRVQYATPGGALLHAAGATATLILVARVAYQLSRGLREAARARREHLARLRLVARRDQRLGALVVDHPTAAAYCLPGRARTVVLTSAAVEALCEDELAAVLGHERAHLRGRHHLVMASADALARTVPVLPVFRWARAAQAPLLEMIADDEAAADGARITVARALVSLAEGSVATRTEVPARSAGPTPMSAVTLGATDVAPLARVQRMLRPGRRLGLLPRAAIVGALAFVAVVPVALAAAPAWAAAEMSYCPLPTVPPPS